MKRIKSYFQSKTPNKTMIDIAMGIAFMSLATILMPDNIKQIALLFFGCLVTLYIFMAVMFA